MPEPMFDCMSLDNYDHTCRLKNASQKNDKRIPCEGECDDYDPCPETKKRVLKELQHRKELKAKIKEKGDASFLAWAADKLKAREMKK